MGLFDSVTGNTSTPFTPQESFGGLLIAAAGCDGDIAESEVRAAESIMANTRTWGELTSADSEAIAESVMKSINEHGLDATVENCVTNLPADLRNPTFAVCVDIVCADGIIEAEESAFIEKLQQQLEVTDPVAQGIVDAIVCKNSI
jgi:uncharacterized tellurite resistance protein B-like protein